MALHIFLSRKKGVSSCQLGKDIGITQKSAWWLLDSLRKNLEQTLFIKDMLGGSVEIDETYIGGSNSNRHWNKKVPHSQGRSWKEKTPTLVMKDLFSGIVHSSSKRTKPGKISEKKSTKNGWRSAISFSKSLRKYFLLSLSLSLSLNITYNTFAIGRIKKNITY